MYETSAPYIPCRGAPDPPAPCALFPKAQPASNETPQYRYVNYYPVSFPGCRLRRLRLAWLGSTQIHHTLLHTPSTVRSQSKGVPSHVPARQSPATQPCRWYHLHYRVQLQDVPLHAIPHSRACAFMHAACGDPWGHHRHRHPCPAAGYTKHERGLLVSILCSCSPLSNGSYRWRAPSIYVNEALYVYTNQFVITPEPGLNRVVAWNDIYNNHMAVAGDGSP